MTHSGVGPVTALATEVFLGDPQGTGQLRGNTRAIEFIDASGDAKKKQTELDGFENGV
jgi:hypothetical protein